MVGINLVAVGMQGPQGPPGPAGSGGLSGRYDFLIGTGSPYSSLHAAGALPLVGGSSVGGNVVACLTVPTWTYQSGVIFTGLDAEIHGIPSSTDGFDFTVFVAVASLDGTNIVYLIASANVGPGVDSTVANLSDLNVGDGQLGSDLTWDPGTGLSTTAGGAYGIVVTFQAGWD